MNTYGKGYTYIYIYTNIYIYIYMPKTSENYTSTGWKSDMKKFK